MLSTQTSAAPRSAVGADGAAQLHDPVGREAFLESLRLRQQAAEARVARLREEAEQTSPAAVAAAAESSSSSSEDEEEDERGDAKHAEEDDEEEDEEDSSDEEGSKEYDNEVKQIARLREGCGYDEHE
jgi:hypothetical protein